LQEQIAGPWAANATAWQACAQPGKSAACPDEWASESVTAACNYSYKGVKPNMNLGDDYYNTNLPVVEMRLAQAGVRLAAVLNRIWGA
jgi:hypothetical protein